MRDIYIFILYIYIYIIYIYLYYIYIFILYIYIYIIHIFILNIYIYSYIFILNIYMFILYIYMFILNKYIFLLYIYFLLYIFYMYYNTYITVQHYDDIYRFDSYWFGSFISSLERSNPVLGSRRKGSREMPVNLYEFIWILLSIRCTMKLAAGPREIKSNSNWRKNPSWLVCIRKNWTKVLNSCIHLGHWHSSLHLISQMGT